MKAVYGLDHPDVATGLGNLAGVLRAQGDLIAAARLMGRALGIRQLGPVGYQEGMLFYNLGVFAAALDRSEAGLRLSVICYTIDRQLGHADAEGKDLPTIRQVAAALDYDEAGLQNLLAEVEMAYRHDRGRGLVAAAFPELHVRRIGAWLAGAEPSPSDRC